MIDYVMSGVFSMNVGIVYWCLLLRLSYVMIVVIVDVMIVMISVCSLNVLSSILSMKIVLLSGML